MFLRRIVCFLILCVSMQARGSAECLSLWNLDAVQGKKTASAQVFTEITEANIGEIFTHQYDSTRPQLYGAKAIAFVEHPKYTEHPDAARFFFFPTGTGFVTNNVHHRDVLSQAYLKSFEEFEEQINHMLLHAIFFLESEQDAQAQSIVEPEKVNGALRAVSSLNSRLLQLAQDLKLRASNRHYLEDTIAQVLVKQAQGFEFTAEYQKGCLQVTKFDVHSSITSMQNEHHLPLDSKLQEFLVDGVLKRIDPKVRAFKKPTWSHRP